MSDFSAKWGALRSGKGSMGESEYRRKAESYLAAARMMSDPSAKSALIDMASRYMELAQQDKRIAGLVEKANLLSQESAKN
jgi:hypothetical protein